ncbi:MAG: hypothetical protein JWP91_1246 [Fibrobacteres bacterium]|nr:hypothetical protein [Fibrobacterota bacterium]
MPRFTSAAFGLTLALLAAAASANEVMSWVPSYGIGACRNVLNGTYGKYKAKDGLTHIGLQFWHPTTSGGVVFTGAGAADAQWFADWGKANNVKVLLTVFNATNGWDWNLATSAFADNHAAFAKALVAEMDKFGLDGVDLDLEGNALKADDHRSEYKAFVIELSALLKAKGKLLTVCTFNNENSDNMPDESWFPDWLGKVDYIHIMGYEEMYETSPDKTQAYSYQQNLGAKAGYARSQVSMGLMASNSWGGGSAIQHLNECITKPKEVASICIWDLQFPGSAWKTEEAFDAMAKIKNTAPVTGALARTPGPKAGRLPILRMAKGGMEFISPTSEAPTASDARGRLFREVPAPR